MLEVRGLSVAYGQHKALEDVSVAVGRGEIVVILGANGAGKSTLLKAISGICEGRVEGSVIMEGEEISGNPAHRIVEAGIALVPEGRGVFADLAVEENLALGANPQRARDDAAANLDRVYGLFPRLCERRRQTVRTMSGGEQQMVAIGRAMMSNPALMTLDEPSLGLSPLLSKELFQNLKQVRQAGIGILLVEQNARASLAIADRGYLLENGHVVHAATAERLRADPAVQAAYLGVAAKGAAARPSRPAAGATQPARPAARPAAASPSAPVAPRPAGPSPADIAAAALAGLGGGQKVAPPTAPPAAIRPFAPPVEVAQRQPSPPPPAPSRPAAPPATGGADRLYGLSINDLVGRAAEESRARHGSAGAARHVRQVAPRQIDLRPASLRPFGATTDKPSTDGQDRVAAMLREMEEAAIRARQSRASRRGK